MAAPRKYSEALRDRATRMAIGLRNIVSAAPSVTRKRSRHGASTERRHSTAKATSSVRSRTVSETIGFVTAARHAEALSPIDVPTADDADAGPSQSHVSDAEGHSERLLFKELLDPRTQGPT